MTLSDWRDVSIILLALEAMVIGFVYGAIFYYSWKGLRIAYGWFSGVGLPQGRRYASLVRWYVHTYSQKVVKPFILIHTVTTQARGFARALFGPSQ